jgi:hypothetical protein
LFLRVWGVEFKGEILEVRVQDVGFRSSSLGLIAVESSGLLQFRVYGLGFIIQGLGSRFRV